MALGFGYKFGFSRGQGFGGGLANFIKWALDLIRQDSTFTCSSVRNVFLYTSTPPSASNVPVLQAIPANVEAIHGSYWDGSKCQVLETHHPMTSVSTAKGVVRVLTAIQNRADSTAYSLGDTVRLITANGNKKWATCTTAGTSAASQPSLTEGAATLTDGTAVWRLEGYSTISGTLLEDASTNKALYSEAFDNPSWGQNGATIDTNVGISPDGATTADRLNVTTANSRHNTFTSGAISVASGVNHTISCFVKDDGERYAQLCSVSTANDLFCAVFDLDTGLVTDTTVGATSGVIVNTSSKKLSNGWWRISLSGNIAPLSTFPSIGGAGSATPTYLIGQATYTGVEGNDLLIYGYQTENVSSSEFATSYIPTTTAAVTRAATTLSDSTSGVLLPALFGFDFVFNPPATGMTGVIWGTYVDANNSTQLIVNPTTVVFRKRVGGADTDLSFTYTHTADTLVRIVGHQDGVGMSLQVADVGDAEPTAQTNTNTTGLQIAATMEFGSDGNGANRLNDNFLSAKISDEVLSW
jgi:hypothetical protein